MKTIKSLIAIIFLLVGSQAFAQPGTGTNPYVGAKHDYYVNSSNGLALNSGHPDNTYYWYLTNDSDVIVTDAAVFTAGQAWGTNVVPVANLFKVDITWGSAAIGDYYLYVKEYSDHGCVSTRRISINVIPNAFDITFAAAPATACNSVSGNVFTDAIPDSGQLSTTTKEFTVQVVGTVNSWKFIPLVSDNNSAGASATYKYSGGDLTVDGEGYITVPASDTPYDVIVTVTVSNLWDADNTEITVNIDKGEDILYGTLEMTEVAGADYAATASTTINPLPLTTEISTN